MGGSATVQSSQATLEPGRLGTAASSASQQLPEAGASARFPATVLYSSA